jgi:arylformamidase
VNFVYLEKSGAEYLAQLNVKGVGIDSLGIERAQANHSTHHILMSKNIIIIEGLRLAKVDEGIYQMYALPLKIKGADGAPARVILSK